jgi:predicted ribosome quality control (RQC) complex YloA/Tae2 family protein
VLLMAALSSACTSAYYSTLEQFGIEKRDILVDRIDDAREAQTDAKEQFATALERYRSVVTFDGGDLEKTYDRLSREYERSEQRAQVVRDRIDSVEAVAGDLFEEWEAELDEYADADLRRRSARLLTDTRAQYGQVIAAMHRAERSMDPVLALFGDQVLFLRHNLNARAVGSLESELDAIEQATNALLADMQKSIDEANAFIEAMEP